MTSAVIVASPKRSSEAEGEVAQLARKTAALTLHHPKVQALVEAAMRAVTSIPKVVFEIIATYAVSSEISRSVCRWKIGKMDFQAASAHTTLQDHIDDTNGVLAIPAKLLNPHKCNNGMGNLEDHRQLLAGVISRVTCRELEIIPSRWVDGELVVQTRRRQENFKEHELIIGLFASIHSVNSKFFSSIQHFRLHRGTVAAIRSNDTLRSIFDGKTTETTNAVYIEFSTKGPLQFGVQTDAPVAWKGVLPSVAEGVTHVSVKRWPLGRELAFGPDDPRLGKWLGPDRAARCVVEETVLQSGSYQDFIVVIPPKSKSPDQQKK